MRVSLFPSQYERIEMNEYRLLVQTLEKDLEDFDLCCPENFRSVILSLALPAVGSLLHCYCRPA